MHFHIQLLLLLLKLLLFSTPTMETDVPHGVAVGLCKSIWSAGSVCRNRISELNMDFPFLLKYSLIPVPEAG